MKTAAKSLAKSCFFVVTHSADRTDTVEINQKELDASHRHNLHLLHAFCVITAKSSFFKDV
jgi:hypothetical protein